MPYEKLVRDIKDILVSHAPEIFNTNMTTYNEAERVSKIAEKYAHDYRDMAMRQEVLRKLLADFYNECQALDQEAQEKPQQPEKIEQAILTLAECIDNLENITNRLPHFRTRRLLIEEILGLTHKD